MFATSNQLVSRETYKGFWFDYTSRFREVVLVDCRSALRRRYHYTSGHATSVFPTSLETYSQAVTRHAVLVELATNVVRFANHFGVRSKINTQRRLSRERWCVEPGFSENKTALASRTGRSEGGYPTHDFGTSTWLWCTMQKLTI